MKKPGIQKQINKSRLLSGAFLGLGFGAVGALNINLLALTALPLTFAEVLFKKTLNENALVLNTFNKLIRKQTKNWVQEYIDDSENLTEKKYKIVFLSMWMRHKKIDLHKSIDVSILGNVLPELFDSGELNRNDNVDLSILFCESEYERKNIFLIDKYGTNATANLLAVLNADVDDVEKMEVAKKVYKEYSQAGMVGELFINNRIFYSILSLQDYKFSQEDYNVIEKYTNKQKKIKKDKWDIPDLVIPMYYNENKQAINNLIDSETNVNNLKILSDYCTQISPRESQNFQNTPYSLEVLNMHIKSRIKYLELGGELKEKEDVPKPATTKKKMKI